MKVTLLFLFGFLLTGCGVKKLAVDNADSLVYYQVTKRIPLYSGQKDELKKDLESFLNRAKPVAEEMLPVIDDIDLKNEEKLESNYNKLEGLYLKLAGDFSDLMAKYLAKLDQKQQKDFFETLDDENREILKREKEDITNKIEERAEMVLGGVTGKQKQLIKDYEEYFKSRSKARLDRRILLHQQFRDIYRQDSSLGSRTTSFAEAFKKYQADGVKGNKNVEILKKLLPTLTTEQREHFRKHAQDIKELLKYYLKVDY